MSFSLPHPASETDALDLILSTTAAAAISKQNECPASDARPCHSPRVSMFSGDMLANRVRHVRISTLWSAKREETERSFPPFESHCWRGSPPQKRKHSMHAL